MTLESYYEVSDASNLYMFRIVTKSQILLKITGRLMVEYSISCAEIQTIPTVSQMTCFVGISASLCLPI